MMSSVMPSLKYSCSGSPLILVKGRTRIEGFAGAASARGAAARACRVDSAIDPDRFGEILQPLFAEILEVEGDLASDLIQDSLGQDDGAGIRQGFQASRDVHSIAVEIAVHDHDIAEIQADAQHQPPVVGQAPIGGLHGLLQLHRALDGSDRARELDQGAVAHQLDQAAAMLVDQGVEDVLARGLECRKRPASSARRRRL